MTSTLIISMLAFAAVAGVIGVLAFVFRDAGGGKTTNRLDVFIGKRRRDDSGADILKKTAFDADKKSLMEMITPNIPSVHKIFQQAECHIKPSTLFGISLLLAALAATASWMARVPWFFAPLAGFRFFTISFLWLLKKTHPGLKRVAGAPFCVPDIVALGFGGRP